jgi:hypothetical protein
MALNCARKYGENNAKSISVNETVSVCGVRDIIHEIDIYRRMGMNEQVLVLFTTAGPVGKHAHKFLGNGGVILEFMCTDTRHQI